MIVEKVEFGIVPWYGLADNNQANNDNNTNNDSVDANDTTEGIFGESSLRG